MRARRRHVVLVGALFVALAGLTWANSERIVMEFSWRALDADSSLDVELREALQRGDIGVQVRDQPCMKQEVFMDLELVIEGPITSSEKGEIVMAVHLSAPAALGERLYLGPPTRDLRIEGIPLCRSSADLPGADDADAWGYLWVDFVDLKNRRFMTFQSEDPVQILAWRSVRVELHPIARKTTSGGFAGITVSELASRQ